ncbi:peptide chain release factor N(5)-glutamine methyltransferase [Candidatus Thioglobus sp.]|nr:peptide chain release factor N(5)-glutamine methyltransferase [Candidatus Thioglobus sp.]
MKTVQDYLKSGAIDVAPLLSLVLEKSGAEIILNHDYALSSNERSRLESLLLKRQQGMPFAYLSGCRGFYHLDFKVTPDTLIPRPETELLIDIALETFSDKTKPCHLLDLGTGSGIIAITLKDKNPHWQVSATDFSNKALEVARSNATSQIEFLQGSWFEPVINQSFDLIISNPPYIEENDAYLDDLSFEPICALTAGKDGLDDIRIIIDQAPDHLGENGFLLLEHGHDQQDRIVKLLKRKFNNIQTFKDYNHKDRAILAQCK